MSEATAEVAAWLSAFEAAVRARDFEAARPMFASDAVAFGTWASAVSGLDRIENEQWRNIWPRIRRFRFEERPVIRATADSAWIAAVWYSEATGLDGHPFDRPGRATLILTRRDGRWLAVHTHFSLTPSQAETVHGRR